MSISKTRIHMICGLCGCSEGFSFRIVKDGKDLNGKILPAVFISCNNCGTLTSLDEVIKEKD